MRGSIMMRPAVVLALASALVIGLTMPAAAEVPPGGESAADSQISSETGTAADAQVSAAGRISGDIVFRASPGGSTKPAEDITVSAWRFNPDTGYFDPIDVPRDAASRGAFSFTVPGAGTYALQFAADPYSGVGSEYYSDARYFFERTEVIVKSGQSVDLGVVELSPRFFDVGRLEGKDRFATAVSISRTLLTDGSRAPVVYVANGYKFPDALAAGPAAAHGGGVFLPTAPDYLPGVIAEELRRLKPLRVVIAGDAGSVSNAVRTAIVRAVGADTRVDRLGGATRYETAALIVRDAFAASGSSHAIVATGQNFPDALAAGPAAGHMNAPVLLVDGAGRLDGASRSLMRDLGVTDVVITGGTTTVSAGLESDLRQAVGAGSVTRLAGGDRYETAGLVNDWAFDNTDQAVLAHGYGFIDALAGGPFAAALGAPLFLSDNRCLPAATTDGLLVHRVSGIWVLGSTATLSEQVAQLSPC